MKMKLDCLAVLAAVTLAAGPAAGETPKLAGDGVTDDTAAIQAMLDTGTSCVYLPPPAKHYLISRPLILASGQELKLDRYTLVRLAPQSNCCMIENRNWQTGDRRIAVTGGVWDFANTDQKPKPKDYGDPNSKQKFKRDYYLGVVFRFDRVQDLNIRGLTIMNPLTYSVQLTRTSFFTVEDITFDFRTWNPERLNMDGIHLDGGCHHGRIANLRGTAFDDMVALNANDGRCSACADDITDIDIDGIYAGYSHSAVRLLSNGERVERITIRNVFGQFYVYAVGFTHYFPGRPRGRFNDIVVENVFAGKSLSPDEIGRYSRCNYPLIQFQGPIDCGTIKLSNINREESTVPVETIGVDPQATIEHLTIRDGRMVNLLDKPIRYLVGRERIKHLTQENIDFVAPKSEWLDR